MSTSFYPETDDSSERSNKMVIEALCYYVNLKHTNWADHLIHVKAAMNNSINATTGKSLTEMVYGTTLCLFLSPRDLAKSNQDVPTITNYIQTIQDNIAIARDHHVEAKTKQVTYANKKHSPEPDYRVGEMAYLETKDLHLCIKQKGRSAKFYSHYVSPFEIIKSNQRPPTTLSSCQTNSTSTPRFTPVA